MTSTLPARPTVVPSRMGSLLASHAVGIPGGETYHDLAARANVATATVRKMAAAIRPGEPVQPYRMLDRHVSRLAVALGVEPATVRAAVDEDLETARTMPASPILGEVLERLPLLDAAGRDQVLDALAEL